MSQIVTEGTASFAATAANHDNPPMTHSTPDSIPTSEETLQPSKSGFANLDLHPATLSNLTQLGYLEMTPIQAASLPLALSGKDLIAQAKTGSGKTAAFGLALLAHLNPRFFAVQALVLCPTRELADQVTVELRRLARSLDNIKVVTLCGGIALRGQRASLENGAHIVVGTPGRVMDHLARTHLNLDALKVLVLDEADRMLDMGFLDDMTTVIKQCPKERQTLLFSATYPQGIDKIARQFMREPQQVKVESRATENTIEQRFYEVTRATRLATVSLLLNHFRPVSTLAFCNTKQRCRELVQNLQDQGFSALTLHGELEQRERDQVLAQFANRSCSVLVATDVAARGLDISQLAAVINVDITPDPEVHVHRIGRTGRAGEPGLALSLASMDEMGYSGKIEQYQNSASIWYKTDELTAASEEPLLPPMMSLQILGGRKEKIRPGDVLGALTGDAGFTRDQVGKINVTEFCTFVAIERSLAQAAMDKLNSGTIKGKSVKVRLVR
jgi:ATP-independent RNA helicase DbpA